MSLDMSRQIFRWLVISILSLSAVLLWCNPPDNGTQGQLFPKQLLLRVVIPAERRDMTDMSFPATEILVPSYVFVVNNRHLSVGKDAGISISSGIFKSKLERNKSYREDANEYGKPTQVAGWDIWHRLSKSKGHMRLSVFGYKGNHYVILSAKYKFGSEMEKLRIYEVLRCIFLTIKRSGD